MYQPLILVRIFPEGTAKSTKLTDGAVEGKFYGNNAVELGGLAKANDNSWGAGFVGKKQ